MYAPNCPNLVEEGKLYRYAEAEEGVAPGEKPMPGWDHSPNALEELVAGIDRRFIGQMRRARSSEELEVMAGHKQDMSFLDPRPHLRADNDAIWELVSGQDFED